MKREPATVPPKPGVYALVNKRRRFAYVAYATSLMKRSHALAYMLKKQDEYAASEAQRGNRAKPNDAESPPYWSIAALPKHPSDEFTFMTLATDIVPADAAKAVAAAQKKLAAKGLRIVDGNRSTDAMVTFQGTPMTLVAAIKQSHSKVKYPTAYRRLERGWTLEQALGLADPNPRWDLTKRRERQLRAQRAGARS